MRELDILRKYDMTRASTHSGVESKIGRAKVKRGLETGDLSRGANREEPSLRPQSSTMGWVDVTPKLTRNTTTTEESPKPVVPWMEEGVLGDVSSSDSVGAFLRMYVNGDGDTYLQGGSVTGGNGGSATIVDEKVLDATTGVDANSGKVLYLQANCTATIEDGIMLPGCLLNSATTGIASAVPSNHSFTTSAATGNIYTEIGRWNGDNFLPTGPAGNFTAGGCIGSFTLSKS